MSIRSRPIKPVLDWQVLKLEAHSAFMCLLNLKAHTFKIFVLALVANGYNYLPGCSLMAFMTV